MFWKKKGVSSATAGAAAFPSAGPASRPGRTPGVRPRESQGFDIPRPAACTCAEVNAESALTPERVYRLMLISSCRISSLEVMTRELA